MHTLDAPDVADTDSVTVEDLLPPELQGSTAAELQLWAMALSVQDKLRRWAQMLQQGSVTVAEDAEMSGCSLLLGSDIDTLEMGLQDRPGADSLIADFRSARAVLQRQDGRTERRWE